MLNINDIKIRLQQLGYDQHTVNWLLSRHISLGSLDVLISEINRMERVRDG